jgi:signal peptidase II
VSFFLPATLIVVLDQLTKQLVWRHGQTYDFIPGYLHLTLVKNAGAAFGLFQGGRVFFIVASVIAAIFVVYVGARMDPQFKWRRVFLGLILGGAIGNLIDRILSGEVIDFIQIGVAGHYWPVFNVADIGVSVGAAFLLIDLLRSRDDQPDAVEMAQTGSPPSVPPSGPDVS